MRNSFCCALLLGAALTAGCNDYATEPQLADALAFVASSDDPLPASASACVERVRAAVLDLAAAGALNHGETNALTSKLDAIIKHIGSGQATVARNLLRAYNNSVDALEQSGRLTAAQAEAIRLSFECATPVAIASGDSHSCVLLADGTVWCWGQNVQGQLGNGSTTSSSTPVQSLAPDARAIEAGGSNVCVLDAGGAPHCWGTNVFGQLGNGTTTASLTATPVTWSAGAVAQLSVGVGQACGRVASGVVYCWGQNGEGQLGSPTAASLCGSPLVLPCSLTPAPITTHSFTDFDVGILGGCGLEASGAAFCWGRRFMGAIGDGNTTSGCTVNALPRTQCASTPAPVSGGHQFRDIQFGAQYACGTRTDGVTMCWGLNFAGQLGLGFSATGPTPLPTTVVGGLTFVSLSADDENSILAHTCGLDAASAAFCWGWNEFGQLGNNATTETCFFGIPRPCSSTPVAVMGGHAFKQVAPGRLHTCGLTVANEVLCWGANASGQLGDGTLVGHTLPAPVTTPWLTP